MSKTRNIEQCEDCVHTREFDRDKGVDCAYLNMRVTTMVGTCQYKEVASEAK